MYLSSEAYDDYGPEHGSYEDYVDLQMPDLRDWEIVEAIACDGVGLEDFAEADIRRVTGRIMITEDEYEQLVADGLITPENLEAEKIKNQEETDRICALATQTTYQLSNGWRRSIGLVDADELFEAFEPLLEDADDELGENLIYLPIAGWRRTAFINKHALDYVMLPTHRLDQGRVEIEANFLDETA